MICSKCLHNRPANTQVRITPTFYHSPIFDPSHLPQSQHPRCSATYHSTIFDGNELINQNLCCCEEPKQASSVQVNKSNIKNKEQLCQGCKSGCKFQAQVQLHQHLDKDLNRLTGRGLSHHKLLWYHPDKEVRLMNCSNCNEHGLSRQRKLIQLESNPFNCHIEQTNLRKHFCGHQGSIEGCEQKQNEEIMIEDGEIDNDSLNIMNQQRLQQQQIEKSQSQQREEQSTQQPVAIRQNIEEKKPKIINKKENNYKKMTKPDCYSHKKSGNDVTKMSTIDCRNTMKRNAKGATGQPLFWAVTKSRLNNK